MIVSPILDRWIKTSIQSRFYWREISSTLLFLLCKVPLFNFVCQELFYMLRYLCWPFSNLQGVFLMLIANYFVKYKKFSPLSFLIVIISLLACSGKFLSYNKFSYLSHMRPFCLFLFWPSLHIRGSGEKCLLCNSFLLKHWPVLNLTYVPILFIGPKIKPTKQVYLRN